MSVIALDPAKRRAAAEEGDELLVTKLTPPRRRPTLVERPRLTALIDEGVRRARPLTVLCAPAGYGKSTAALLWCETVERPSVWLSLDEDDAEPARLVRYLCAAISAVREAVDTSPPPPGPLDLRAELSRRLSNALVDGEPFTLVLDDLHRVSSPEALSALDRWLDVLPACVHIVITTREEPDLHLPRRRARDEVTDIDLATLRFSVEEARAFYKATADVDLDGDVASAFLARTEGWAAALQLSSISLRRGHDARSLADQLSGQQRDVADYLTSEVLADLDDDQREFLLSTSICERFSAPLCEAVSGLPDAQRFIEDAESAGLFIIALDHERRWYRYHHLFAELLRAELRKRGHDVGALHARAARFFNETDDGASAVAHAAESGDAALHRATVQRWAEPYLGRAEPLRVRQWLEAFDEDAVFGSSELLIGWVWSGVLTGDRVVTDKLIEGGPTRAAAALPEPVNKRAAGHVAGARAFALINAGRAEEAQHEAMACLAGLDDGDGFVRAPVALGAGIAACHAGAIDGAVSLFERAIADGFSSSNDYAAIGALSGLQDALRACGRFDEARLALEDVRARYASDTRPALLELVLTRGAVAIAQLQGDPGDAHATDEELLVAPGADLGAVIWGELQLATRRVLKGEPITDVLHRTALPTGADLMLAANDGYLFGQHALLSLLAGDDGPARRLTANQPLDELVESSSWRVCTQVLAVLLATDDPAKVALAARTLQERATTQGRRVHVVDLAVAEAVVHARAGSHDAALAQVEHARALAESMGYRGGLPLLYAARLEVPGPAGEALRTWLGPARPAADEASAPSGEAISERELEVLQLVSEGLSNPAIGKKLFISTGTVKTHVHRLLQKLGADNRTEAARIARQRGLISG